MYNCYMCGIELNDQNASKYVLKDTAAWHRCRNCTAIKTKQVRTNRKSRVHSHYGNKCIICDSTDNLHLDHINGNGNKHKKQINKLGGTEFYAWIEQNNYPEGFQLLCEKHNRMKTHLTMDDFIAECKLIAQLF